MTQKRLVEIALSGAKTKQIALCGSIKHFEKTKPDVAKALRKALEATLNDIRELTEMLEGMENG